MTSYIETEAYISTQLISFFIIFIRYDPNLIFYNYLVSLSFFFLKKNHLLSIRMTKWIRFYELIY